MLNVCGKFFEINPLKEYFLKLENIYQSFLNEYIGGGAPRWFFHRISSQRSEALNTVSWIQWSMWIPNKLSLKQTKILLKGVEKPYLRSKNTFKKTMRKFCFFEKPFQIFISHLEAKNSLFLVNKHFSFKEVFSFCFL